MDFSNDEVYMVCPKCNRLVRFKDSDRPDKKFKTDWTGFCGYCEEDYLYYECFPNNKSDKLRSENAFVY